MDALRRQGRGTREDASGVDAAQHPPGGFAMADPPQHQFPECLAGGIPPFAAAGAIATRADPRQAQAP